MGCFCATLYTCYKLIKPDVAIELAWRNGYTDFVMPYVVQYTRHLHEKVAELEARTAPKETAETEEAAAAAAAVGMMYGGETPLLTNGPVGYAPGMPPMPD